MPDIHAKSSLAALVFCLLTLGPSCASSPEPVATARFVVPVTQSSGYRRTDTSAVWRSVVRSLQDMPAPVADWRAFVPYATRQPPDDAPEEIFITWWAAPRRFRGTGPISDAGSQRILEALPRYPELVADLMSYVPYTDEARDVVAAILATERKRTDSALSPEERDRVADWVRRRQPRPLDELRAAVRNASHSQNSTQVDADQEMRELLRRWPAAAIPLLERHETGTDADLAAWARKALLEYALKRGDDAEVDRQRAALRPMAENPKTPPWARYEAISVLMDHDWPGRDEWFVSLAHDPTLIDLRMGVFVFPVISYAVQDEPDRLAPLLLPLVGHEKDHVHLQAVRSLSHIARPDTLRALAPWISDPTWSRAKTVRFDSFRRHEVMKNLGKVRVPEAIPHLIEVLKIGESHDRAVVATALADLYKVREAGPTLRAALDANLGNDDRMTMVRALAKLDGMGIEEARNGVEAYAILTLSAEDRKDLAGLFVGMSTGEKLMTKLCMGMVAADEFQLLSDRLADRLAVRTLSLADWHQHRGSRSGRDIAGRLREILSTWPNRAVMRHTLADWAAGRVERALVPNVLKLRAEYAREVDDELRALIDQGGPLGGVAAVMLGEQARLSTMIAGRDKWAKLAVLATARLVRLPLVVAEVVPLLTDSDKQLAVAAERYLEALDTRDARNALYAHHRGELHILGAREHFPGKDGRFDEFDPFNTHEADLVERMRTDETLDEIHALISFSIATDTQFELVLEVRAGAATLIRGDARRALKQAEWRAWSKRLVELGALDLPPLTSPPDKDAFQYEFVHLTRTGGRRLFMNEPGVADPASPYQRLLWRMNLLR